MQLEQDWTQTDPSDLRDPEGPPLPDTETLLSELGAFYPVVAYPDPQEDTEESDLERTIYAGLVFP